MITEVTAVNDRITRLRITHTLCVISLVFVYAAIGVSESSVKQAFYAQVQMVVDSSWVPLAVTEMAVKHVVVHTALDQEMKAPQWSLTLRSVGD